MGQFPTPVGEYLASPQPRLRGLMARYHVPEAEGEDCVQETWLALFEEREPPDWRVDRPGFEAWLSRVVWNEAMYGHRRSGRHALLRVDEHVHVRGAGTHLDLTDGQDTSPAASSRALIVKVRDPLEQLTEASRDLDSACAGRKRPSTRSLLSSSSPPSRSGSATTMRFKSLQPPSVHTPGG